METKVKLADCLHKVRGLKQKLNTALDEYCKMCACIPEIQERMANTNRAILAGEDRSVDGNPLSDPYQGDRESLARARKSIDKWAGQVCEIEKKLYFARAEVDGLSRHVHAEKGEKPDD